MLKKRTAGWCLIVFVISGLLLAGCATQSTGPVRQNILNVEMMINQAKQNDAEIHAPLELKLAQEKLEEARKALEDEEIGIASQKAEEAMMKAKIAEAKARTAKSQKRVQEEQKDVEMLQNEINRQQAE